MKKIWCLLPALFLAAVTCLAEITVFPSEIVGPIKPMNGVNNGPKYKGNDQQRENIDTYRHAHIPFARTHDAVYEEAYGNEHTVDISGIFRDFDKDANDPKSYDFTLTDVYLKTIRDAGTEVFFRLGQSMQTTVKKYYVYPPKDYKKWAVICEHIIRHYNEGWADGFKWNIRYWEIWNEADLGAYNEAWKKDPRAWGGTEEMFHEFYAVAAKHLKSCFPNLKIGGPSLAAYFDWGERFLAKMEKENVPMDFFSWHHYGNSPSLMVAKADSVRQMMDAHGYKNAESILNEWQYLRNWTDEFRYTAKTLPRMKGAAYVATAMSKCQDAPVDAMMYYDARIQTLWNGLLDLRTLAPTKTYYSIYAWSRISRYGKQIKSEVKDDEDISVTAAADDFGKVAIMVTRYNEDNNVCTLKEVKINAGMPLPTEVIGHLTDEDHTYTEVILDVDKDGKIQLKLQPNAVVVIEI